MLELVIVNPRTNAHVRNIRINALHELLRLMAAYDHLRFHVRPLAN